VPFKLCMDFVSGYFDGERSTCNLRELQLNIAED
jgi:hypothetical protein